MSKTIEIEIPDELFDKLTTISLLSKNTDLNQLIINDLIGMVKNRERELNEIGYTLRGVKING